MTKSSNVSGFFIVVLPYLLIPLVHLFVDNYVYVLTVVCTSPNRNVTSPPGGKRGGGGGGGGGLVGGRYVEGTSVITGPKCNKSPKCNNIWS